MQGMMIQDFSPKQNGGKVTDLDLVKDVPEQPFGQVLGEQEQQPVSAEQALQPMQAESNDGEPTAVPQLVADSDHQSAEAVAEPFFMAALFDQTAALVQPSEKADLVAAAERTQELVAQWLSAQQPEEEPSEQGLAVLEENTDSEDLMTAALNILEQTTQDEAPKDVDEEVLPALSVDELEELKQMIAVMVQSGQVPQPVQDHPQLSEISAQLGTSLTDARGKQAVQKLESVMTQSAAEFESTEQNRPLETATESKMGLQEEQIAKILTPRHEQPTLREAHAEKVHQLEGLSVSENAPVAEEFVPELTAKLEAVKAEVHTPIETAPQQHAQAVSQVRPPESQVVVNAPKVMQLPSGLQIAESQVVDQVVTHLAGSQDGESARMRLRLHPAELGSLRLDLIVEGDKVRAHLQAQSQQVQEVLDRNLPQLRDALQQQGLKIDEFRVDVQTGQDHGQGQGFAWRDQQQGHRPQSPWQSDEWAQPEIAVPLEQLLQQNSGGISLRV